MAQTNTSDTSYPTTVRFPFVGVPLNRSTATKDQRYINWIFEVATNPVSQQSKAYLIKRPGLTAFSQPPLGAAAGRGVYAWNGKIYSVFGNVLYSNTTAIQTISNSTGRVGFTETPSTFGGGQLLIVNCGTNTYTVSTSDVVTEITDIDYPDTNLGFVEYFDGYIFVAKSNGEIWNSNVDSALNWAATSFLSSEMFADELEAIARQKDQIIAFGKTAVEFYFDNANATGSPLLRIEQNAAQIGMATKNSFARIDDVIIWVSRSPQGLYSVWRIDGLSKLHRISTPMIEKLLNGEESAISSCSATMVKVAGHTLYILNLATTNRTLVFDAELSMWCEWADTANNKFNCLSATELNGTLYLQDASNGRIYTMSPTVFQDNSINFTCTIQTDKIDFDTLYRKTQPRLELYGDTTTGSVAVSYSDDDYTTFSTPRNIDMSLSRKVLRRLGSFRRRAYKYTYTDNFALRLEGAEHDIFPGAH